MRLVHAGLVLGLALATAAVSPFLLPPLRQVAYVLELLSGPEPVSLPVPVQGVDPAELVDTWGAPRGRGRRHEGIDVFARCGRPVLSTTEGLVLSIGHSPRGGRTVWVLGPGGLRHYYAHLRAFGPPRPGARVRAGDILAYVGDSGNAKGTPCHLHYGIYGLRGPARNPYPLLTADRERAPSA